MRIVAVLVLAAAIGTSAAQAEPVDAVFQHYGLFGNWAVDCKQAASPSNPHVSVTTPSPGLVLESHNLGEKFAVNKYSMLSAEGLSPEQMSVEVIFQPGTEAEQRQKLVFLIRKNTRRAMFNQPQDGEVRVKDGIVLAFGTKTPVLEKCE
jgi:hypothetical protein